MLQRTRSRMASLIVLAVAAMAGFVPTPTSAAEGTIFMRVVNVAPNDVLNIRERPSNQSRIIGIISPNATGVEYRGQKTGNWLLVYFGNAEGWVHKKYVIAEVAAWTRESDDIPTRFLGTWCHDEMKITIGPNFVEGRRLRCHVPKWAEFEGPGDPIMPMMSCFHKNDINDTVKIVQLWTIEDGSLMVNLYEDGTKPSMNRLYGKCQDNSQ